MHPSIRNEKRNVTPEKAIKILLKHGTNITLSEAIIMLELLYKLANLSVNQVNKYAKKQGVENLGERRHG
jgi:hypothetical protein